jgi:hypothetical protein
MPGLLPRDVIRSVREHLEMYLTTQHQPKSRSLTVRLTTTTDLLSAVVKLMIGVIHLLHSIH